MVNPGSVCQPVRGATWYRSSASGGAKPRHHVSPGQRRQSRQRPGYGWERVRGLKARPKFGRRGPGLQPLSSFSTWFLGRCPRLASVAPSALKGRTPLFTAHPFVSDPVTVRWIVHHPDISAGIGVGGRMFVCLTPFQSGQKVENEPQNSESIRQCCWFLHPKEKTLHAHLPAPTNSLREGSHCPSLHHS